VRLLRHQRQGIRRVTGTDDVRRCPSRSTSTLRALNSSRWCRTQPPTTWCDNARCDEEPRASAPSPSPLITRGHPIRPTHGFITIDCIAQGPRVLPPRYSSIVSLKGISATALPVSSDYEPPPVWCHASENVLAYQLSRAGRRLLAYLIKIGELDTLGADDGPIVVNDVKKVAGHNRTTTSRVFFRRSEPGSRGRRRDTGRGGERPGRARAGQQSSPTQRGGTRGLRVPAGSD
jgi:hypothetical protein